MRKLLKWLIICCLKSEWKFEFCYMGFGKWLFKLLKCSTEKIKVKIKTETKWVQFTMQYTISNNSWLRPSGNKSSASLVLI